MLELQQDEYIHHIESSYEIPEVIEQPITCGLRIHTNQRIVDVFKFKDDPNNVLPEDYKTRKLLSVTANIEWNCCLMADIFYSYTTLTN